MSWKDGVENIFESTVYLYDNTCLEPVVYETVVSFYSTQSNYTKAWFFNTWTAYIITNISANPWMKLILSNVYKFLNCQVFLYIFSIFYQFYVFINSKLYILLKHLLCRRSCYLYVTARKKVILYRTRRRECVVIFLYHRNSWSPIRKIKAQN